MKSVLSRTASHAGSWYTDVPAKLDEELSRYLSKAEAEVKEGKLLKAIIGPHAGFTYSGPTAAWAYKYIDPTKYDTVFLLGPAHHKYIKGCALSQLGAFETPLGDIQIDTETTAALKSLDGFTFYSKKDDEEEHSLEMHAPYIKKIFGDKEIKLVPIVVGSISHEKEKYFGSILAPYFKEERNLFIISSDFCHWGRSFDYCPVGEDAKEPVSEFI
jgi:MEMO1 family protein